MYNSNLKEEHIDIERLYTLSNMHNRYKEKKFEIEAILDLCEAQLRSEFNLSAEEALNLLLQIRLTHEICIEQQKEN